MPKKATNKGHCQVCGHLQKLPNGRLSKHGYTTRCGFFEGTCFGAEHLPFEQDISLIQQAIEAAKSQSTRLNEAANITEASTDPNNVTYNAYEDWNKYGLRKVYGYRRIAGKVEQRGDYNFWFVASVFGNKYEHRLNLAGQGGTLESVVKFLNWLEAQTLRRTAKDADDYIAWQQSRIKGWKPTKLQPV